VVLAGGAVALLQLDPVSTAVANRVMARLDPWPGTVAHVGSADLRGLGRLVLTGVRVGAPGEVPLLALDTVEAHVRLVPLLRHELAFRRLYVGGLRVAMRQRPDSTWDLLAPFAPGGRPTTSAGPGPTLRLADAEVRRGSLRARYLASGDSVLTVEDLTLKLDTLTWPHPAEVVMDTLDARIRPPARPASAARLTGSLRLGSGTLATDGVRLVSDSSDVLARGTLLLPDSGQVARDIDFAVTAAPLDFRDVGALVPGFDVAGSLRLDAHVTGSTSELTVRADGTTFDGGTLHIEGDLTPRTRDSLRYALRGRLRGLDPSLWSTGAPPLHGVDADLEVSLTGPRLDSLTGNARFDVAGARMAGGTLRPTRLEATFREGTATFDASGSAAPWARFEAHGTARPLDPVPSWDARATVHQLDPIDAAGMRFADAIATVRASGDGVSPSTARGRARLDLGGAVGKARVEGGSLTADWDSAAAHLALDLPVGVGRVSARARADWEGAETRVAVRSLDADSIDVAELLGDTIAGTVSVRGTGALVLGQPGRTTADADLVIERATWQELDVDSGTVSLTVRDGTVAARARAVAPAGAMELIARAKAFTDSPSWQVDTLRLRGLDLATVREGLPHSDINALLRLDGRGFSPGTVHATGSAVVGPTDVAAVRVDTATLGLSLQDGRLDLTADARAMGGAWTAAVEARPFEAIPTVRITHARFDSIQVDSTVAGPVRATLSGTLEADATLPPDTFPRVHARLAIESGRLNAEPIDSATVMAHVEGDTARVDATLRTAGGRVDAHAAAALARDTGGLSVRTVRADGVADLTRLAPLLGRDSVDGDLRARFTVRGGGTAPRTMRWSADASASGRYGPARLDSMALKAGMERGVLRLDTLSIASNFLRGGGSGWLPLFDTLDVTGDTVPGIDVALEADSVATLADLLGTAAVSARGAGVRARATRENGMVRVVGSMGAGGVISAMVAADTLHADFSTLLRDGRLASADVGVHGGLVSVAATVLQGIDGTVDYDSTGASFASRATLDQSHEVRVVGSAARADSTIRLDSLSVDLPTRRWRLARPVTVRWGDRIDPGGLELAAGSSRIALGGHLDRSGTQDLTIRLDSVPLAGFADLAGIQRLEGVLDGSLDVGGPASDVTLAGRLDARIGGTTGAVTLRPAEGGGLGVDVAWTDAQGDPLRVVGTVPFPVALTRGAPAPSTPGAVALDISARSFSLGWVTPFLGPLGVERFDAALTADGRLQGTLDQPSLTGSASLAGGRVEIPRQGVAYADVHGDLEFAGDHVHIPSLTATSEGTAEVSGDIALAPLKRPGFDLKVHARRFQVVDNAWTRLRTTGDLTLSGDLGAPVVGGSVQLEATDIYLDQLGQGVSVRPVELTAEDYRMLESYFGYRPPSSMATPADPLLPWSIHLSLDIGNDVWVRRRTQPELRVQVDGSLDVRKQPGDSIQLFGTVESLAERSYVEQFGRRFSITSGSVTFNGSPMDWRVSAEATYDVPSSRDPRASEAVITMDVSGGPDDLRLTLGSQPAMENADILSYLATGQPAASAMELGSPGSGAAGGVLGAGEAFALGQVAGALEETAQQAVGLDVVEIRQNGLKGVTVVAGRYVNPRLFVGFQQPLTLAGGSDPNNQDQGFRATEVQVEYTWYRWLLVNVQGGQSALRLFFRTKYAY